MIKETSTNTAPSKLTKELQHEVCKRLAAFEGPTRIAKWLKAAHGIEVDKSAIVHYKTHNKWADQFQRYRAEWQTSARDRLWLANAGGRVEELQKMYQAVYKGLKGAAASEIRSIRGELRVILSQIQTELPGAEVGGAGGVVNINLPDYVQEGLGIKKDTGK